MNGLVQPSELFREPETERSHRRLEHLYEISKLLIRSRNVEETVAEVLALVAQTLPIHSAILILERPQASPLIVAWQVEGEDDARLQEAHAHALKTYGRLVGAADRVLGKARARRLPTSPGLELEKSANRQGRFFLLPLVVGRGEIFGALQLEDGISFDENGLSFVNAVVNQLAIAIDRQTAIATREAAAEEADKEQRLLAQVGSIVAESLGSADTLTAIARCTVPLLADLCVVDELDDDGVLRRLDVVYASEYARRDLSDRIEHFSARQAQALETGEALLLSEIGDRDVGSEMVLPLVARGRRLGVLTFVAGRAGRRYSARDLSLALELAHRAAISIDNRRLYEQALRATRAREDLLAVVSHDLRNPLGALLINVSMMLRSAERDRRTTSLKPLLVIQRSANRMNRLIDDLLDTASIEGGRLSVEVGRVDVRPLISETFEALSPLAMSKALNLRFVPSVELPDVLGDAPRLQQVLANLVGNAIKFTPEAGTITVRAEGSDGTVTISVTDSGCGIPVEHLPQLFERLWRAKSTASLGTGLGLYIVKGIVDSHGGRVWVESAVGRGSTFFFTLLVAPG